MGGAYKDLDKKRAAAVRGQRRYIEKYPERKRDAVRKYTYGMTREQYDAKLVEQDGKCALCGLVFVIGPLDRKKSLVPHVDHDHGTGQLRSLLCDKCNRKVGHYEMSNVVGIQRYLARWQAIHR
jgi:5-methylcytosine-specific restriction endonuclease McrA